MTSILFFVKVHMAGLMSLAAAPLFTFLILREVIHHRSIDNPGTGHLPLYRHSAVSLPAAPLREETGHDEALIIPDSPQQRSFLYDGLPFTMKDMSLTKTAATGMMSWSWEQSTCFPLKNPDTIEGPVIKHLSTPLFIRQGAPCCSPLCPADAENSY